MRQSRDSLASASVERRIGSRRPMSVEFGRLGGQAGLDVAQTLAVRQLGERHDLILSGAGQLSHRVVAVVARNNAIECAPRQKIHKLREQRLPGVHRQALPSRDRPGEPQAIQIRPSNELQEILVCQMLSGKFSSANRTAVSSDIKYYSTPSSEAR